MVANGRHAARSLCRIIRPRTQERVHGYETLSQRDAPNLCANNPGAPDRLCTVSDSCRLGQVSLHPSSISQAKTENGCSCSICQKPCNAGN
ncbi:hypothetical protein PCANC_03911 [Puccinia coronata f. sp. avenae]|uniref:Uncharacterized protein n=1 Tax=Puccinia coronata f. sp. avenae TaxID=200324 RepID=A0A2N5W197_9BASI|nr:hypothetical protein PCANC_03911 [Puccinia coronata f. sp. avenae]